MAPPVARLAQVVYGDLTIGGSSDIALHGTPSLVMTYPTFEFSCEFDVVGTTAAGFATTIGSVEDATRTIRDELVWTCDGATVFSAVASSNTGFNQDAELALVGSPEDTALSRRYRLTVRGELPADLDGQNGRRDSTIVVRFTDAGRQTITLSGEYTALASNSASAQYAASIEAYVTAAIASFGAGGTYRKADESYEPDEANKVLKFSRTYEELLPIIVTYGSLIIGTGSDPATILVGAPTYTTSYPSFEFSCEFTITAAEDLASSCAAIEALARTPRQALTVTLNGDAWISHVPASNTGFDQEPDIRLIGAPEDSDTERRYRFTVRGRLPANLSGQSGRLDAKTSVQFAGTKRRIITLSGTYTALSTNSASAQYLSVIDTYGASILTTHGGGAVYEITADSYVPNDTNKLLEFTRTYTEVLYDQSSAGRDLASLIDPKLTITIRSHAPGDSGVDTSSGATVGGIPSVPVRSSSYQSGSGGGSEYGNRLVDVVVRYQAEVDKTVTQDIKALWDGTVRPFLIDRARSISGLSALALVEDSPDFGYADNTLSATLAFLGSNGSRVIESSLEITTTYTPNTVVTPAWDGEGGWDSNEGNPSGTWAAILVVRVLGWSYEPPAPTPARGILQSRSSRPKYITIGLSPNTIQVTDWLITSSYLLVKKYKSGNTGAPITGASGRRDPVKELLANQ